MTAMKIPPTNALVANPPVVVMGSSSPGSVAMMATPSIPMSVCRTVRLLLAAMGSCGLIGKLATMATQIQEMPVQGAVSAPAVAMVFYAEICRWVMKATSNVTMAMRIQAMVAMTSAD